MPLLARCSLGLAGTLACVLAVAAPAPAAVGNGAPTCAPRTVAVDPGGSRLIRLECDDFDGPFAQRHEIVAQPRHGTVGPVESREHVVRYTPAPGYRGADAFTFRGSDGVEDSAETRIGVEVTSADLPPVCSDAAVTAAESFVTVAAPCADPNEGDATTITITGEPEHGVAMIEDAGRLGYGPRPGYTGDDAVGLSATDGRTTVEATVPVRAVPLTPPACTTPPVVPVRTERARRFPVSCTDRSGRSFFSQSYTIVSPPRHGSLVGDVGGFQYVPDEGYRGPDEALFRPVNRAGEGEPVALRFEVADDANEAPACYSEGPLTVRSGATSFIRSFCLDGDDDPITSRFSDGPAHGRISGSPSAGANYTADAGYAGEDSFVLQSTDGRAQSERLFNPIRVIGEDENSAPACSSTSARTRQGRPAYVALHCADAEGDPLSVSITQPDRGSVSGAGRLVVYQPPEGFSGVASFGFEATDGRTGSVRATARVTVDPQTGPVCPTTLQEVRTDRTARVSFFCSSGGGSSFTVVDGPDHGTLTDNGDQSYSYTPAGGYEGDDAFTVRTSDSTGETQITQRLRVARDVNTRPFCFSPGVAVPTRGAPVDVELSCYDVEGDAIELETLQPPEHGTLGEWDPQRGSISYTPDPGYVGPDTLRFRARDARAATPAYSIGFAIRSEDQNSKPQCGLGFVAFTDPGRPVTSTVFCRDGDGDAIALAVADPPEHGTLSDIEDRGAFTYTPEAGFEGVDAFALRGEDDRSQGPPVRIEVNVGRQRFAPRCESLAAGVEHGRPRTFKLDCRSNYPDNGTLPVEIVTPPTHGDLSAPAADGTVTYTPAPGFTGPDRFEFRTTEDGLPSPLAAVDLTVGPPPPAPPEERDPPPPQSEPQPEPREAPSPSPEPGPEPEPGPVAPGEPALPVPVPFTNPASADPDPARAAALRLGAGAERARGVTLGPAQAFVAADAERRGLRLSRGGGKAGVLAFVCPETACSVTVRPRLELAGSRRPVRLPARRLRLRADEAGLVTVRLSRRDRARVARAPRASLRLALSATGADGARGRDVKRLRVR